MTDKQISKEPYRCIECGMWVWAGISHECVSAKTREPPPEIVLPPGWLQRDIERATSMADEKLRLLEAELVRLREFVQWVADHSNDPAVVQEARRHGAERW